MLVWMASKQGATCRAVPACLVSCPLLAPPYASYNFRCYCHLSRTILVVSLLFHHTLCCCALLDQLRLSRP